MLFSLSLGFFLTSPELCHSDKAIKCYFPIQNKLLTHSSSVLHSIQWSFSYMKLNSSLMLSATCILTHQHQPLTTTIRFHPVQPFSAGTEPIGIWRSKKKRPWQRTNIICCGKCMLICNLLQICSKTIRKTFQRFISTNDQQRHTCQSK